MFVKQRIYYGLILTAITLLLCYVISLQAFNGNAYYTAQLVPFFMGVYVLVGWLIHLRKDTADPFWHDALYSVLWAACLLALAATLLYWFFGVGARFYN